MTPTSRVRQKRPRSVSMSPTRADTNTRESEWKRNKRNIVSFAEQTQADTPTSNPADSKSIGRSPSSPFGGYRLLQILAHKRMTMVSKSVNIETGEIVVMKTVFKDNLDRKHGFKALKLLRKEALVLSSLQGHPRIIPLVKVYEDDDRLCIIMRYAEGGDLFEYIRARGSLSREAAYRIFGQIVEGISFAHSRGFIHRDIKPENIFLDRKGNVFIGDWGFATQWSAYRLKNQFYGSPLYISPEVLSKRKYIGPELDMFALGVVLFACLTGRLPFGAHNKPEYRKRVLKGLWCRHPYLSHEDCVLLERMLDPNPITRATPFEITTFVRNYRTQEKERKLEEAAELEDW